MFCVCLPALSCEFSLARRYWYTFSNTCFRCRFATPQLEEYIYVFTASVSLFCAVYVCAELRAHSESIGTHDQICFVVVCKIVQCLWNSMWFCSEGPCASHYTGATRCDSRVARQSSPLTVHPNNRRTRTPSAAALQAQQLRCRTADLN